jgi:hypothetical protein
MSLRMAFVAGFLTCVLVTWLLGKRRETAQPVSPTTEDAKWDKRINEMDSIYAEEKANSRLGKR